jgi:hypothetical protein
VGTLLPHPQCSRLPVFFSFLLHTKLFLILDLRAASLILTLLLFSCLVGSHSLGLPSVK